MSVIRPHLNSSLALRHVQALVGSPVRAAACVVRGDPRRAHNLPTITMRIITLYRGAHR